MPNTGQAREQLLAIFGSDLPLLPEQLRIAARHHRDGAEHLRRRQPDALIPADGARMLAAGHDLDADRCDRIADQIEHILHGEGSAPVHPPARRRRPHVIVLTADAQLRSAVSTAAARTSATVAIYETPGKARQNATRADLLIIGVDMARWFTTPITGGCLTVVAGVDPVDRTAASDHAHRLDVDLFVLSTPDRDTLTALLAKLPGAKATT
ncbi:hypothetical protein AB0B66_10620 [Catellatospora sp. NPDC049111]|uniref:hypothetical protein n=1 Tax=Catellatospora sp. NPDC049111 TaxID=3155271 RepID=UPI0033E9C99B